MRVLAFLPVVAAVSSSHEQIESLKATFRGMAQGEISEDTRTTIRQFMNVMNTTLRNALDAETEQHQGIMNTRNAAITACGTARTNNFADASTGVRSKRDTRDASRLSHMQCKNCNARQCVAAEMPALAQWPSGHNYSYDTGRHWGQTDPADYRAGNAVHDAYLVRADCTTGDEKTKGEEALICETQDRCTDLDNTAKSAGANSRDIPDFCPGTGQTQHPADHQKCNGEGNYGLVSRDYYAWETGTDADHSDDVYTWFSHMDSWNTTNSQKYKDERAKCHDLRAMHSHKTQKCFQLQSAFERDYCAWTNAIDTTCHVYEGCYRSEHYTFDQQKIITQGVEAQLKAQQAALECALCYGEELLKGTTDLDACDRAAGCQDCERLDIDYPTPADFVPCSEAQTKKPCTADFISAEYGCLADNGGKTPANDCTVPCSDADKPDWPANATLYTI